MKERLIENCVKEVNLINEDKVNDWQKAYRECLEIVIEKLRIAQMQLSISVETREFERMDKELVIQHELNDIAREIVKLYKDVDGYL